MFFSQYCTEYVYLTYATIFRTVCTVSFLRISFREYRDQGESIFLYSVLRAVNSTAPNMLYSTSSRRSKIIRQWLKKLIASGVNGSTFFVFPILHHPVESSTCTGAMHVLVYTVQYGVLRTRPLRRTASISLAGFNICMYVLHQ